MKTFLKFLLIIVIIAGVFVVIHFMPIDKGSAGSSSDSSDKTGTSTKVSNGIIINEVMSDNKGIYPDDRGDNSDWAEIYNSTDSDVSLQNYSLSDDTKNAIKWPFPNITLKAHGYLMVFLSGDSQSDLQKGFIHCSFKLSAKGETLYMYDASRQLIDSVEIPSLEKNVSYGLTGGKWQIINNPTPGFENSDAGAAAFKASRTVQNPAAHITEVMPKNRVTIKDAQGNFSDWVEIMNTSGKDMDLTGCGLSDDPNEPMKWKFPDLKIKAGGFVTVFCNGNETGDGKKEIDASFKLSSTSSTVVLSDQRGCLMDSVQVPEQSTDWSYGRTFVNGAPTNTWQTTNQPSPGYPNTSDGFANFMKNNPFTPGDIVISEVLTSNNNSNVAQGYDFIEIENRGKSAVNLKGYGLTNNASNPAKFQFPDTTIQAGKQLIVIAAGQSNDKTKNITGLKTTFKLSRLGDNVSLFNADGKLLDRYFIGAMQQNYSIGRQEGQTAISYFSTPTPGQANGTGCAGIVQDIAFSQQAGKYDSTIQLSLSSTDGSEIYYTTNGDTPTKSSTKYTGAIPVDKTMSIRAKAFKDGYIDSNIATATYFIGTKHTLPVVSITTEYNGLFDPNTGIYTKSKKYTEVPASFELCDGNGKRVFQQNIGLDMTGGLTLSLKQQKSLAIYARSKYGKGTMAYKFFDNRNYTEYKSLILRTAGREGGMVSKMNTYVALGLVDGKMNVLTQAAKPCVVYIDGKYWGIYYLMEKRNKHMVAQHEGITDKKAIDAINLAKGSGGVVNNGSGQGYKDIYNYINSHDMSQQENYDWVAARLDTDSFMDFIINEIYIANNDPGNIQIYQIPPKGLWKQIYQDLDIAFSSFDTVALRMNPNTPGSDIFNALLKNKDWQDRFIKRFAWALKNIYNTGRVTAAINDAAGLIRGEVGAEYERWSSERPSLNKWEADVSAMKNFAKKRPAEIVNELKQHFTLTDEEKQLLDDAIK